MRNAHLYPLTLFILSVFNLKSLHGQDTAIVGKAHNAKYGAIVVSSNNDVYYIDKVESWSADINEKTIKVTGKIVTKKMGNMKPGYAGITDAEIKIIKKAKVQVLPGS